MCIFDPTNNGRVIILEEVISLGIYSAAQAYSKIMDYEYRFVVVRNRNTKPIEIILHFEKDDFHHLCGLHKLVDIEGIRSEKREIVFDKIIQGIYTDNMFSKSFAYDSIADRIDCLESLQNILDDKNVIFKFNKNVNKHSKIEADYIINSEINEIRRYYFIFENSNKQYSGCSCFSRTQDKKDYTKGHTPYTILYKGKINLNTQKREDLYFAPSYKKELDQKYAKSQSIRTDNIKQIKFDNPTPQNILHNSSGTAAAVLPAPNPFKNLFNGLKNLFKKQDKTPAPAVQADMQSEIIKNEIIEENTVPSKLDELIEARAAFVENKITLKEYQQALTSYIYSFNGKEMWTEAAEILRKQLKECPDNHKKPINYEIDTIERNFKKRFAPKPPEHKQTLDEIKRTAHEQYIKMQNEKSKSEKEEVTVNNYHER